MARLTAQVPMAALLLLLILGCEQQQEGLPQPVSQEETASGQMGINPGPEVSDTAQVENPYVDNIEALQDGRRFYTWYNCNTCHGPYGGGAIGPPLRDTLWIYGSDPLNIYKSIAEGRPEGMPAWGGKIPEEDLWKLVAYLQSLSQEGGSPVTEVPEPTTPPGE